MQALDITEQGRLGKTTYIENQKKTRHERTVESRSLFFFKFRSTEITNTVVYLEVWGLPVGSNAGETCPAAGIKPIVPIWRSLLQHLAADFRVAKELVGCAKVHPKIHTDPKSSPKPSRPHLFGIEVQISGVFSQVKADLQQDSNFVLHLTM